MNKLFFDIHKMELFPKKIFFMDFGDHLQRSCF